MPTWLIIVTTATVSYLLSLVVRVLTSREKRVEYRIEHLFSVGDDQFLRSMESLLPAAWPPAEIMPGWTPSLPAAPTPTA